MTEAEFRSCPIAYREALVEAWRAKETRINKRIQFTEREAHKRTAGLMAVIANSMTGSAFTAADFLKSKKRKKSRNQNAEAAAFFAPLIRAGLAQEIPNDSN